MLRKNVESPRLEGKAGAFALCRGERGERASGNQGISSR